MAVYGYDQYGRSKYGPYVKVDYGVDPFIGSPLDYSRVYLTWSEPVGTWDEFRLLRSRSGYATDPEDGQILISFTKTTQSPPVDQQFLDFDLVGGYYYYTILLHSTISDVWEVAAATSVLVPWDYDSTEMLWNYLPEYYRVVREGQTAGYSEVLFQINPAIYQSSEDTVDNEVLFNFLRIFGWGYDILRSQIETIRSGFDPATIHVNRLALLADMLGASLPDTVPTQNNRNLVRNLALLYRKRGTLDGLRENLALTSGWDVDVYQGPNILLSRDQAAFVDLNVPYWDEGTRYITGDIVRYNNYYRQALQTSYGAAQAPPTTPTSNAFWSVNPFTQTTPLLWNPWGNNNTSIQNLHGWQVQRADGANNIFNIGLGLGITNPLNAEVDGALTWVQNVNVFTTNMLVRSIPAPLGTPSTQPDRNAIVKYGLPVPRVTLHWTSGQSYSRGDRVVYLGRVYQAITETLNDPTTSDWNQVGFDERPRLALSFYAHGPFVGTAGTGGVNVTPWVAFYDEAGVEILAKTTVAGQQIYDSFTKPGSITTGKLPDVGSAWSGGVGAAWGQAADEQGGYVYPVSTGVTTQGIAGTTADGNVGTTFRKIKTRALGVYFRYSGTTNFWEANQTGLFKTVAGTRTQVGASYTCVEGDRLTVSFVGSSIIVKKNGTTVVTTTDSFNSTATGAGILAGN